MIKQSPANLRQTTGVSGALTHVILVLIVIISLTVSLRFSDLWKDGATGFATVGFFITLYGVMFAIIEVLRTKAAAEQAAEAAEEAARSVEALYETRNSVECQTLLENALERIHEDGTLSPASLGRIVKLYAAEFSEFYHDAASPTRLRMSLVTSYATYVGKSSTRKAQTSERLKEALVLMMADLAAANDQRIRKEPIK